MTDDKLRPCPFDGGVADIETSFVSGNIPMPYVLCSKCGAATNCYQAEAEAVAVWNTRATDTQVSSLVSAGAALAEAEADYRWKHDTLGGGNIETGRAWDKMRRCGEAMRAALDGVGSKCGE